MNSNQIQMGILFPSRVRDKILNTTQSVKTSTIKLENTNIEFKRNVRNPGYACANSEKAELFSKLHVSGQRRRLK